jgi:tetratricopeptide (TPR) repeat protein
MANKDPHINTGKKRPANLLIPAGIAAVTWLFLKVCLNNQFTNWDDPDYVVRNPLIKDVSWDGLKAIFSTPVMGNYHPLTILSYAIEYSVAAIEPWLYHFDSLVLHIIATLLVYWFVNIVTRRQVAAAVTALLFGLHPMHMESVAWVAGRKDELCALFYIMACIAHVYYTRAAQLKKWRWYIIVIALFICALLSKPIAVTLPLTLLLIDHFEKRKWKKSILIEKTPHFILSLIFGIISIKAQYGIGAANLQSAGFNAVERIMLGAYALLTYLWKAIIPANLCCFYPYPKEIHGSLPAIFYAYPFIAAAIIFITWKFARKNKTIVFGSLFFIVNIALLLQLIPVGNAMIADRYTYIPYIGLFFIAGWYVSEYFERNKQTGKAVLAISLLYTGILGYYSHERCKAWYDSITLWTDELAKEPTNVSVAYDNLGFIYYDKWYTATDKEEKKTAFDSAFYVMKRSTELWPDSVGQYQGMGMLYYAKHNYDSADLCFKIALRLNPTPEGYSNYGNLLVMLGRPDSAIKQYDIAISQNPDLYAPYLNRGKILRKRSQWDDAMKDFNTAIAINPRAGELYYERSFCDTQMVNKALALRDVETAISLGYNKVDSSYYNWLKAK